VINTVTVIILGIAWTVSWPALSAEVEMKTLNCGATGFFVFAPEVAHINPGETVNFVAVDKGHDVHSVPGMIPEGAEPFDAKMSQNIKVMFTVPGVYVVACKPHTAMGMVGVVVVGDPTNIDKINPNTLPSKARTKLDALLEPLKKS
jgi:pseudoazurin